MELRLRLNVSVQVGVGVHYVGLGFLVAGCTRKHSSRRDALFDRSQNLDTNTRTRTAHQQKTEAEIGVLT